MGQTEKVQPAPSCELENRRIQDCEALVQEAEDVILKQMIVIRTQEEQVSELDKMLDQAQDEAARANRWYRNPSFVAPVMLILGMMIGAQASGH